MNKHEAIQLLGGSTSAAAKELGVSYQAIRKWPDQLPQRISDRVEAALFRRAREELINGGQRASALPSERGA